MLDSILKYLAVQEMLWVVVLAPLSTALLVKIISFFSKGRYVFLHILGAAISFAGLIIVWYVLYNLKGASPSLITGAAISWTTLLSRPIEFGLKADQLSLIIAGAISFIGLCVNIYSVGYTAGKKDTAGTFSSLGIAISLSLLVVFSDSIIFFFAVWQFLGLVGLMIQRNSNTVINMRNGAVAFAIELLSGACFLFAAFMVWNIFDGYKGLNFDIFQFSSIQLGSSLFLGSAGVITLLLLIGAGLRSTQFPFYIWTAEKTDEKLPLFTFFYGTAYPLIAVYLLVRCDFLFILSPQTMTIMAVLGGVVALFGAIVALLQDDARKVLAYFAISQTGVAFAGAGVGAFAPAIFFIFIFAIYSTLIFFAVGSVAEAAGTTELKESLGLKNYLPVTFWTMFVGTVSASAIFPFAGFYSGNSLIWEAYQRGYSWLFLGLLASLVISAMALFRMSAIFFFGKPNRDKAKGSKEEISVSMLVMMVILAFASFVAGWLGIPEAFGGTDLFGKWLEPGLAAQMVHVIGVEGKFSELVIAVIVTLLSTHAGFVTWIVYVQKRSWTAELSERFPMTGKALSNALYLNTIYEQGVLRPFYFFSETILNKWIGEWLIEGLIIGGIGRATLYKSSIASKVKCVNILSYLFWFFLVFIVLMVWSLF